MTGCANKSGFTTFGGQVDGVELGGVCQAFPRPEYQIKGATPYDQEWADKTTEAGVAGCNWQRPEARPAHLAVDPQALVKFEPPVPAKPKKKSLWKRLKQKIRPSATS